MRIFQEKRKWFSPLTLGLAILLLSAFTFAVSPSPVAAEEHSPFSPAVVTADTTVNLNIRQGPGVQHAIIGTLPAGTVVGFTGFTDTTRTWVQVDTALTPVGWVAARFLTHVPADLQVATAEQISPPADPVGIGPAPDVPVTTVNLNVRQGPGVQHAIVDTLMRGTEVELTGLHDGTGEWVQVETDATTGWVAARFLSQVPLAELEPLPAEEVAEPEDVFSPAVVTAVTLANLNIRQGPGVQHAILDTLPAGTVVGFTGFTDSTRTWVQVDAADGPVGWVAARFLSNVPAGLQVLQDGS
jgi:uncharacterized protein YraI